jgi:hypothetical protein
VLAVILEVDGRNSSVHSMTTDTQVQVTMRTRDTLNALLVM